MGQVDDVVSLVREPAILTATPRAHFANFAAMFSALLASLTWV
jgi:hypothetical protein